jgi:hypothetical protein
MIIVLLLDFLLDIIANMSLKFDCIRSTSYMYVCLFV